MALIKCDGISIAYEGQTVVRDLSFWIEQGDYPVSYTHLRAHET